MTLKEVGEALREERLRRDLTIDDVMKRTKVSRRHVEAMEEGRLGDLPHPVYVKGFMKTYSTFLDVEISGISRIVDMAFAEYAQQDDLRQGEWYITDEVPLSARRGQKKKKTAEGKTSRRPEWLFVPLVLLLLSGIGFLLWFIFHIQEPEIVQEPAEKSTASTLETPALSFPAAPLPKESAPVASLPSTESPDSPDSQMPSIAGPETRGQVAVVAPERPAPAPQPDLIQPSASQPAQAAETAGSVPEELQAPRSARAMVIASEEAKSPQVDLINILEITGDGNCRIEARVDAALTTDITIRRGERVDIRFAQTLSVKFGNVKMVRLRYNGRELASQVTGEGTRTLTFPPGQ